jgi:DNA-binding MarR family transcriptional regulator
MSPRSHVISVNDRQAVWQLMSRTTDAIRKVRDRELEQHGISARANAVLFTALRQGPKATPASVSQELILQPHTVSEQLMRLEKEGLIRRLKDTKRRNIVRITVTQKGWELYRKTAVRRSNESIIGVLNVEERKIMWSFMVRLRSEAAKRLDVDTKNLYPPSDQTEFIPYQGKYLIEDDSSTSK